MNSHIASRKADLAAIHIAKARLGWSDDEYRDILQTVCNVRSSAQLDVSGRKRFLAHQQACLASNGHVTNTRRRAQPLTDKQRLMWSLWQQLADANKAHQRTRKALNSFVQRQTQVDQFTWLNAAQEDLVIESLKKWLKRGGQPDGT